MCEEFWYVQRFSLSLCVISDIPDSSYTLPNIFWHQAFQLLSGLLTGSFSPVALFYVCIGLAS